MDFYSRLEHVGKQVDDKLGLHHVLRELHGCIKQPLVATWAVTH